METPRLSVVLPSWGRKELTLRMLYAVLMQTFDDYELFFLGDKCPVFDEILQTEDYRYLESKMGNRLRAMNFAQHDGTSAQAINHAMSECRGEFFLFLSNDDYVLPDHFRLYYETSSRTQSDFCIFNTCMDHGNGVLVKRVPQLLPSKIGHSELCISAEMTKRMPPHTRVYGHDWQFISTAIQCGYKYTIIQNEPTYIVNLSPRREHHWEATRIV